MYGFPSSHPIISSANSVNSNTGYHWQQIIAIAWQHQREIILAQVIALLVTMITISTPFGLDLARENVITVLQHPAIFNDTLRMNLTLGRDLLEAQLWQALDIAQLTNTVTALELGLDMILGQRGIRLFRLSGGQYQRVVMARMILANPKVVILDEATSALDTETELKLHTALHQFLAGKTTIIIAHRLSAVKQADRVLVLDQGKIIEDGKHDFLIHKNGLYAKLYLTN